MLFASVSSSYAYQATVDTWGGTSVSTITVNSHVTYISLTAYWDSVSSYTPSGEVSASAYGAYSDVYNYNGWNNRTYTNTVRWDQYDYGNQPYIGTFYLSITAWDCVGHATLTVE